MKDFEIFGDIFGPIHIGAGETTAGDSIQKYELLRWRATELGTLGQLDIMHKKAADAVERKAVSTSLAAARIVAAETQAVNTAYSPGSHQQTEPTGSVVIPAANKGVKCSNFDYPQKARYSRAMAIVWSKCPKDCSCSGTLRFCPDAACKIAFETHKLNAAAVAENRVSSYDK